MSQKLIVFVQEPPLQVRAQLVYMEVADEEKILSMASTYTVKAAPSALPFVRLAGIEPDEIGISTQPGDLVAWPLPERPGRKSRWMLMLA